MRIFLRLNGMWRRFGPSRLIRLFVRDRAALEQSVRRMLEWDFDRVVVAHGDVLEEGGKRALEEAWLR
jgi:glyoxylase-like metal-dependent hydrolase (beta-lactamase superfamily II)